MLGALAAGAFIGQSWNKGESGGSGGAAAPVAAAAPDSNVERYKIPVGNAPRKGPEHAKVTILQWSDYQCPFCSRVEPTVDQIVKAYGKDVRVFWKNQPLPFHQNAMPAAQIATAAFVKGGADKFWKLHDLLFKNQQALDRPSLEKYAKEVGLSDGDIKEALDDKKYDAQIKAESAEGTKFGASGTPSFFINGRPLSGAQPFDNFKKIIDEEMTNATKAMSSGAKLANVYESLTQNGKLQLAAPPAQAAAPAQADPNLVYKVPVGDSPDKGPKSAKVTIVEFSDFQCPFCSRVEPTLTDLEKEYGQNLRVVWKNNPLPFHQNAMPAAKAAMAAAQQGKFWQMHEKLFANQQKLDQAALEEYAKAIGLDMGKFKAAMSDPKIENSIKDDMAVATRFGALGTPNFFINGRPLRGAQPKEEFKKVVDKEMTAADALLKKGVKANDLYAELTKEGKDKVEGGAAPAAQKPSQPPAPDQTVYKALVGDAPVKGADAKHAKVTIVQWSDYQCPFCSRVEPTIDQVMKEFGKDVRVAFKQLPLPMHSNAHVAAEAALAAKAQGKFWQMHDLMFKNQSALDRPSLEKYAQEVGLNLDKFKADLDSGKWKHKVDEELAEGNKIGATGTPSFFVNGKSLVGAQPFDAFKNVIEAAIKEADAKVKNGNFSHYYDDLMKSAKTAPAGGGEGGAEAKVYKVDPGSAPSTGPKGAPVQIVEFSDFQCPFCSKVVPTIKEIEQKYGNKVRVSFRHFPLPFHQNAQLAAEAAMAANAQGKFWEMHDKLFANQQALDRPSLDKYAQEIGLDVSKFKADLDGGKFKAAVTGDVQYANSVVAGGIGTPTFFINGHMISGAQPMQNFAQLIDAELAKKPSHKK